MKLTRDGWTGLACLVASLVLFGFTIGLRDNPLVPIGPGFYPRVVLVISGGSPASIVNWGDALVLGAVFGFVLYGLGAAELPSFSPLRRQTKCVST